MKTIRQKFEFEVVREDGKYNKAIKWFANIYRADGSKIMSTGYETKQSAYDAIRPGEHPPFHVGGHRLINTYVERSKS